MSIEEKFNQTKGSVKEGFGKLTGDTTKEAVEGAVSGVKNIFKKDGE